jgi:CheY-like chemotaxis protein
MNKEGDRLCTAARLSSMAAGKKRKTGKRTIIKPLKGDRRETRPLKKEVPIAASTVRRVLVVEDHGDSREVLARLLRHWGAEVVTAVNLASALDLLDTTFDAIIADIGLPDGSGYAVINEAKRRHKNVLGIALSGYASPIDVDIGKMAGFDHHLTKPFDCEEIRSLLAISASNATAN